MTITIMFVGTWNDVVGCVAPKEGANINDGRLEYESVSKICSGCKENLSEVGGIL